MELGFKANAGPLNQIDVQLFSIETAVHLAVGVHGWWTGKARVESLQQLLLSRNASLAAVASFSLHAYEVERSKHTSYGAARQPGGRFISIRLPKASTSSSKDPGVCCLRAVTTALLCFLDEETTGAILVAVLPGNFLHYEQEDVIFEKDGPLHPAVHHFVKAVAGEESISRARESILHNLDSHSQRVSTASRADIQKGESIDLNEVESLLAWVSVSFARRDTQVYPTRSFLVWAIAFVLADLGFEIEVSTTAITTIEHYAAFVENNTSLSAPTVYFVGASVGPTDPRHVPGHEVQVVPRHRYIPIHTIPAVELRKHLLTEELHKERLISIWKDTFEYVQDYLTGLPHIQKMMGLSDPSPTRARNGAEGEGITKPKVLSRYQKRGISERSRFWTRSSPESLEALLSPLICKFLPTECPDCTSLWDSDRPVDSCWSDEDSEPEEGISSNHNERPRLHLNAILLATSYAIACLFLRDGDSSATLDTEVVFRPSRAKSIGNCFEFGDWCENMMSIAAVGMAQKHSTKVDSGLVRFKKSLFQAISGFEGGQFASPGSFGCFANGVSMVSLFLLQPMHPASYLAFNTQFGRVVDLPLDENDLIESIENQTSFKPYEFSPAANLLHDSNSAPGNEPIDTLRTRWDIEPDWANSPRNILLRCRLAGIPRCSFSPRWLQPKLAGIHHVTCRAVPACRQESHTKIQSTYIKPGLDQDEIWTAVPYTLARRLGHHHVRLTAKEALAPHRRHYLFVKVNDDQFEQALALTTLVDPSVSLQKPIIERFLTNCLSCGVTAARDNTGTQQSICVIVFVTRANEVAENQGDITSRQ